MNSIEVLRDSLDEHAALAPDAAGILEGARTGAARVRRRRRVVAAVAAIGAVAAIVAVALVVPVRAARLGEREPPAAPYPRGTLQLTVVLLPPGNSFEVTSYLAADGVQLLGLLAGVTAEVHDPGSYDPTTSAGARRIELGRGSTGWAVPAFVPRGPSVRGPLPAVARRDPTGAWIIVYGAGQSHDVLVRAVLAVQLGPARDVRVPYQLGWVPDGLHAVSVEVLPAGTSSTVLKFEDSAQRLMLQAVTGESPDGEPFDVRGAGPPTPIGGYDTWYLTPANASWLADSGDADGGALVVRHSGCGLMLRTSHRGTVTRAMMEEMVRQMTFRSCHDQPSWTAPLR